MHWQKQNIHANTSFQRKPSLYTIIAGKKRGKRNIFPPNSTDYFRSNRSFCGFSILSSLSQYFLSLIATYTSYYIFRIALCAIQAHHTSLFPIHRLSRTRIHLNLPSHSFCAPQSCVMLLHHPLAFLPSPPQIIQTTSTS